MAKVSAFRKMFVGVGVLIAIGIISSTVGNGYMLKEGVSGDKSITVSSETQKKVESSLISSDKSITVSAETQKQIEASLVGDKKEGNFSVGDGQLVFAERR